MPHEPSGSCPPVQQAPIKRCATCDQARPLAEFATTLAGRRRAAAVRLLIALHPQEWAGLLALVGDRRQATSHAPAGGGADG